jgi:hypothetical protein
MSEKLTVEGTTSIVSQPYELLQRLRRAQLFVSGTGNLRYRRFLRWALNAVLLLTAVLIFIPLHFGMPINGLDPSWQFAMEEAVARHMAIGTDLAFTFGPYASVFTHLYHPLTYSLMLTTLLCIAVAFWVTTVILAKPGRAPWILLLYGALLAFPYFRTQPLLLCYPLLAVLAIHELSHNDGFSNGLRLVIAAIVLAPLGMLALVKGSLLLVSVAMMGPCLLLLLRQKKYALFAVCCAVPIVVAILAWVAAGQPLQSMPAYLWNTATIASGYTEAMSTPGNASEIIVYLGVALLQLAIIMRAKQVSVESRALFGLCCFLLLLMAFKGGFVRHDGHALLAAHSLLLTALALTMIGRFAGQPVVLLASIAAWAFITSHYQRPKLTTMAASVRSTFAAGNAVLLHPAQTRVTLDKNFDAAIAAIKKKADFPVLEGTTDIYSFFQSYLIASGNEWKPRPVFQSYAAYAAPLALKNRDYLLSSQAPDNIIFNLQTIDNRLPMLDDGASWPVLLNRYEPTQIKNGYLYLRKAASNPESEDLRQISDGVYKTGEKVSVPDAHGPVFAEIAVKPTLLGRLVSIFFKPPQLAIELNFADGLNHRYRFVAGMGRSGFVISPLVQSTLDFALLYANPSLAKKRVASFTITLPNGGGWMWKERFTAAFKELPTKANIDLAKIYDFDGYVEEGSAQEAPIVTKCDGHIDLINEVRVKSESFTASVFFKVSGWLSKSTTTGQVPNTTLLVLTDSDGKRTFIKTRRRVRPDVATFFRKPTLKDSGFTSMTDVSKRDGNYTLQLGFLEDNRISICSKPEIKGHIQKPAER